MTKLQDPFDRKFSYLRLSVTDVCNFRCVYCLPKGYQKPKKSFTPLTLVEIKNLVLAFSELGITKVRLTGGEPTTRHDIVEIARVISEIQGIKKIALTTNGYRLSELVPHLKATGLSSLNVSVDSLDPENFSSITGKPLLHKVLDGISRAIQVGIASVKINVVYLKKINSAELERFLDWAKETPVAIRFIELMETGKNKVLFQSHHLSLGEIQFYLLKSGWSLIPKETDSGPAWEYCHPEYRGQIGVIAPYSKDFCQSCNRLRISSQGELKLCLFGEKNYSLRHLLQSQKYKEELKSTIQHLIYQKPISHFLHEGKYGNTWNLSSIGG